MPIPREISGFDDIHNSPRTKYTMMPSRTIHTHFPAASGFRLACWSFLSLAFAIYVFLEHQTEHANELRYQSLSLADELRQSSDDLTRMVRSYVITGDHLYKQNYQEILDIRDGKKPDQSDIKTSTGT